MTNGSSAVSVDAIASMSFERGFVQHTLTINTLGGNEMAFSIPTDVDANPVEILDLCIKGAKEDGKKVVGAEPT